MISAYKRNVMSAMCFLIEIMFILEAITFHFERSYDKRNLTLVVILQARFIHCITSCHKNRMITRLKTFWRVCNAIDNGRVNSAFFFFFF